MDIELIYKSDKAPVFLRKLHDMFAKLDTHDHGDVKVVTASINIDKDLSFNNFAPHETGFVGVVDIPSSQAQMSTFFKGGECYLHPYGGDPFALTIQGSFNATLVGAIVGDYSASDAYFSYDSQTKSYSFEDVINTEYSDLYIKSVVLHSTEAANPNGVIISASDSMTNNVTITLPDGLPDASSLLQIGVTGALSYYPDTSVAQNSFVHVDGAGNVSNVPIDFSFVDVEDSYKIFQFKADGTSVGVDDTGGVVFPKGGTGARPTVPSEGMVRVNTDLNTLEVYDGAEWGSVTVVSGQGLSLNDLTDVNTSDVTEQQFLMYSGGEWVNYQLPAQGWGDVSGKPTDITDLSLHSVGEFQDVITPSTIPDNWVLGIDGTNVGVIPDLGTTAVWGNMTGDIADQDLGLMEVGEETYDFTAASIQKRLTGWVTEEFDKLYESKLLKVATPEEQDLEEDMTETGAINLKIYDDFATTTTSIFDFANMPVSPTPTNGQTLVMNSVGQFELVEASTSIVAPVLGYKDAIYTHDGVEDVALMAPQSENTTFLLEYDAASEKGIKWTEVGTIENSPITKVYKIDSSLEGFNAADKVPVEGFREGLFSVTGVCQATFGSLTIYADRTTGGKQWVVNRGGIKQVPIVVVPSLAEGGDLYCKVGKDATVPDPIHNMPTEEITVTASNVDYFSYGAMLFTTNVYNDLAAFIIHSWNSVYIGDYEDWDYSQYPQGLLPELIIQGLEDGVKRVSSFYSWAANNLYYHVRDIGDTNDWVLRRQWYTGQMDTRTPESVFSTGIASHIPLFYDEKSQLLILQGISSATLQSQEYLEGNTEGYIEYTPQIYFIKNVSKNDLSRESFMDLFDRSFVGIYGTFREYSTRFYDNLGTYETYPSIDPDYTVITIPSKVSDVYDGGGIGIPVYVSNVTCQYIKVTENTALNTLFENVFISPTFATTIAYSVGQDECYRHISSVKPASGSEVIICLTSKQDMTSPATIIFYDLVSNATRHTALDITMPIFSTLPSEIGGVPVSKFVHHVEFLEPLIGVMRVYYYRIDNGTVLLGRVHPFVCTTEWDISTAAIDVSVVDGTVENDDYLYPIILTSSDGEGMGEIDTYRSRFFATGEESHVVYSTIKYDKKAFNGIGYRGVSYFTVQEIE